MEVTRRYRYRIHPTRDQEIALAKLFGCCRVVYNDVIALREQRYRDGLPPLTSSEISRLVTTVAKRTSERGWLAEVSSVALQQAVRDADTAYRNFFNSCKGKRPGPRIGKPKFKSRRDARQTARFSRAAAFKVEPDGRLRLPGIGGVKVVWSRDLPSDPSSVTIIRERSGHYFATFVVERESVVLPRVGRELGIDLGLAAFLTDSEGRKVEPLNAYRRAETRLARAQRELSRKSRGSNNFHRARQNIARLHRKVKDARSAFLHELSTAIIRENQTVVVETLGIKALGRTWQAKGVHDAGWGMFVDMLRYKAEEAGRDFVKLSRWFPSSQVCSACWHRTGPKPLGVREWTCQFCAAHHDRDVNAAKVILAAGLAERRNGCGPIEDLLSNIRAQAFGKDQAAQPGRDWKKAATTTAARQVAGRPAGITADSGGEEVNLGEWLKSCGSGHRPHDGAP